MKGECIDCKYEATCHKEIGIIWGFCNTDFAPTEDKKEIYHVGSTSRV